MADEPYVAVFEMGGGHVAYAAAHLRTLPDFFGAGPVRTASASEKEGWAKGEFASHDGFTQVLLRSRGLRAISLRLHVRPGSPDPLSVAYILRTTASTEARAEHALRAVWPRFLSAFPHNYFDLATVPEREQFDALFEFPDMRQAAELRRAEISVPLTEERKIDYTVPFADSALRWNDVVRDTLGSGENLVADICLTPVQLTAAEAEALRRQSALCLAVRRVTGSERAAALGSAIESCLTDLANGAALVRVAVATSGAFAGALSGGLRAAFQCAAGFSAETVPPEVVAPTDPAGHERALHAIQFLYPPAAITTPASAAERRAWLCTASEAARLFRPPALTPQEHPRVRFAVPSALEEALEKEKLIHLESGATYLEKGAQITGSTISVDLHREHVGGDKVAGDQIVAGDKVSGAKALSDKPADTGAGEVVGGDKVSGDQIIAGDKISGKEAGAHGGQAGIQCTKCDHVSPFSAKFCGKCGAPLPRQCPSCGHLAAEDARFCTECGAPLNI